MNKQRLPVLSSPFTAYLTRTQVETPTGVAADIKLIDPREPVAVVPILRAGLVPIEKAQEVLPSFNTFHVGYVRDEETLQPALYLNKLPEQVRRVHQGASRRFISPEGWERAFQWVTMRKGGGAMQMFV